MEHGSDETHVESEENDDGRDDGCWLGSLEKEGDEKVDGRDGPDCWKGKLQSDRGQFRIQEILEARRKVKTRRGRLTEVSLEEHNQQANEVDHCDRRTSLKSVLRVPTVIGTREGVSSRRRERTRRDEEKRARTHASSRASHPRTMNPLSMISTDQMTTSIRRMGTLGYH